MQNSLFAEEYPHIPEAEEIRGQIAEQGYAEIPYTLGKAATTELFNGFQAFIDLCDMPGGERLTEAVRYAVNQLGNGAYFLNYRLPGAINPHEIDRAPGKDHKHVFHFGGQTTNRALAALGALPPEMADFLQQCDEYYDAACVAGRVGAAALGLESTLFSKVRAENVHHLRLIDYKPTDEDLLGEDHFDRSVATLALSESSPGLQGAPGTNGYAEPVTEAYINQLQAGMRDIEHHEHVAKFFLAAGLAHLPADSHGDAQGLPLFAHGIKNIVPDVSRQAVVFFMNPHARYPDYTVPSKFETGLDDIILGIRQRRMQLTA